MTRDRSVVYVGMGADMLHPGHVNILEEAAALGEVTVGLLTDEALASYKRVPLLTFDQRRTIVEQLRTVARVVPQTSRDLCANVREIRPDFVVHGDDWKEGPLAPVRARLIETLKDWGGQLVEPPYTKDICSSVLHERLRRRGALPTERRRHLHRLLALPTLVRAVGVHDGLSGFVAETTRVEDEERYLEFDVLWLSAFTQAASMGRTPEQVDLTARLVAVRNVLSTTTKPVAFEARTPLEGRSIVDLVRTVEGAGVSAVVLGDESLTSRSSDIAGEDALEQFARRLSRAKRAQLTDDMLVVARAGESTLGSSVQVAASRAGALLDAGADAVFVWPDVRESSEVEHLVEAISTERPGASIIVSADNAPTVPARRWLAAGARMVTYESPLLRRAFHAMATAAEDLLRTGTTESSCPDSPSREDLLGMLRSEVDSSDSV